MKKVLFFAAALVAACTMTGCKKDCTCTTTIDFMGMKQSTTQRFTPEKGTTCKDYEDMLKMEIDGEDIATISCK